MKRRLHVSAAQTALLVGAGGVIMSLSFLVPALFYESFQHSSHLDRALIVVPPFLLGFYVMLRYSGRLKRGIKDGIWLSGEIEALRYGTIDRLWRPLTFLLPAIWVCSLFTNGRIHELAWTALPCYLALNSLHTQLIDPNKYDSVPFTISTDHPAPLSSNHWGQH